MRKSVLQSSTLTLLTLACCGLVLTFSTTVKEGVLLGLQNSVNTVVPSLFPLLCLGSIMVKCLGPLPLPKCLRNGYERVFNLPSVTLKTAVMGLLGGYPTGCAMAREQFECGQVSKRDAKVLMLSYLNCGPAFSIIAVGESMMGSRTLGIILFVSTSLASVIIAVAVSRVYTQNTIEVESLQSYSVSLHKLPECVEQSATACLIITGWIALFSAIIHTLDPVVTSEKLRLSISVILEVTNACLNCKNPVILAVALGFGGLCVNAQVLPYTSAVGLHWWEILLARISNASLSALFCWLLTLAFPQAITTVAIKKCTAVPTHSGVSLTVALIVLVCVFILDRKVSFGFKRNL